MLAVLSEPQQKPAEVVYAQKTSWSLGCHMEERRKARRSRQLLSGQVQFNNRCSAFDCLIRDLSAAGARLHIPSTIGMPANFELTIQTKQQNRRARIVWLNETTVGVQFADGGGTAEPQTG